MHDAAIIGGGGLRGKAESTALLVRSGLACRRDLGSDLSRGRRQSALLPQALEPSRSAPVARPGVVRAPGRRVLPPSAGSPAGSQPGLAVTADDRRRLGFGSMTGLSAQRFTSMRWPRSMSGGQFIVSPQSHLPCAGGSRSTTPTSRSCWLPLWDPCAASTFLPGFSVARAAELSSYSWYSMV